MILLGELSLWVALLMAASLMLVGNTIVSWTAQALSTGPPETSLATLGDPESLSAMVQGRAQLAVRALG